MQGRLGNKRMPTFCYVCGIVEHKDIKCSKSKVIGGEQNKTMQYGDQLRASLGRKKGLSSIPSWLETVRELRKTTPGHKQMMNMIPGEDAKLIGVAEQGGSVNKKVSLN